MESGGLDNPKSSILSRCPYRQEKKPVDGVLVVRTHRQNDDELIDSQLMSDDPPV